MRPFGDRILVRPDPRPEMAGRLHIPEVVRADNPNYYGMTGTVLALGDGVREDVYRCQNRQCGLTSRRTVGERCPQCGATQALEAADGTVHQFDLKVGDRVLFGRFAGKQVEVELPDVTGDLTGETVLAQIPQLRAAHGWNRPVAKMLIMREIEVLGVLTGNERVLPGYEPARWNKPSAGLTPIRTEVS